MLSLLKDKLWITKGIGLELINNGDEGFEASFCDVNREKNSLNIESTYNFSGSLISVVEKCKADYLALTLNGKGVFSKKTSKLLELNSESLGEIFPNLNISEFYIQNFINGKNSFISIARKDYVDQIISSFQKGGVKPLIISLGPFPVSLISDQLNNYGAQLEFNGHMITLNSEKEWENYKYIHGSKAKYSIKVDIEPLDEKYVVAYATAFQLLLYNKLSPVELKVDTVSSALSEFREEKKFNFWVRTGGLIVFTILLVCMVCGFHFSSENKNLSSIVNSSSIGRENVQNIHQELVKKENLILLLGWKRRSNYAFQCDQIAQSLQPKVYLRELVINPNLTNPKNSQESNSFAAGVIKINGSCSDLEHLNTWMILLTDMPWVEDVKLNEYSSGDELGNHKFEVMIRYN